MQLAAQVGQSHYLVLAIGGVAIILLLLGERWLPGRPVALAIVALSIVAATLLGLPALGIPVTGEIPAGLPSLDAPALRARDVEGNFPLAAGCLLLAYVEGVSAARTFAAKHGYTLDSSARVPRPRHGQSRGGLRVTVIRWQAACRSRR